MKRMEKNRKWDLIKFINDFPLLRSILNGFFVFSLAVELLENTEIFIKKALFYLLLYMLFPQKNFNFYLTLHFYHIFDVIFSFSEKWEISSVAH